jgi:cephalosporin-C deacetylase-like acetyl esterase
MVFSAAAAMTFATQAADLKVAAADGRPDAIYKAGEPVRWRIEGAGFPSARYLLFRDGAKAAFATGEVQLADGAAVVAVTSSVPATLMIRATAAVAGRGATAEVGAAVSPGEIKPSTPRPADFDAFWAEKIAALARVPTNAVLEPVKKEEGIDYCRVQMDNLNGSHVYGQLAKPARTGKFPALLLVQYAGIYPLPPGNVTARAKEGWLAFNIMAHDLPFDRPKEFYDEAQRTTHKDYMREGRDSRETSYYLRMMLGCYRAADFLANHPEWDGKTLYVAGVSQGGYQSLVTAAIHPRITACSAVAPAGCDLTGPEIGRGDSHPYLVSGAAGYSNRAAVVETARYFDVVNFAPRIKCPTFISNGLRDASCKPAGIFAAYNLIPGPKSILVMPEAVHDGSGDPRCSSKIGAWRAALLAGRPPL